MISGYSVLRPRLSSTVLALSVIAVASLATAQSAADSSAIRQGEAQWASAVVKYDRRLVDEVLSADFVEISDSGRVYSRDEAVDYQPTGYIKNTIDTLHIRFFGHDAAVAWGAESWAKKDGTSGRVLWTDTWVRRDGKWQVTVSAGQAVINDKH